MNTFNPSILNFARPNIAPNLFPFIKPKNQPFAPNASDPLINGAINVAISKAIENKTSYPEAKLLSLESLATDIDSGTPYGFYDDVPYTKQLNIPVISWIDFYDKDDEISITLTNILITVSQTPKIIRTNNIGSDGSIKTYAGEDDYNIEIEGYIDNTDGEGIFPRKEFDKLKNLIYNQGNTLGIKINSPFLKLFGQEGIDYILVTNYQFPQEEGKYSQQKLVLSCISDSFNDADIIFSPYIP